jgi:putative ABC transport system permease protein
LKIIFKFILQNLREKKLRTSLILLSIILSTALFFASLAVGESFKVAIVKQLKGYGGKATVIVSAVPKEDGETGYIKESIIPQKESIKNMLGIIEIPAIFKMKDDAKNFTIIGMDLKKFNEFNKLNLVKEKGFDDFTGDKIIISDKFSKKYKKGLGDIVALQIRGNSKSYTIVAIGANDSLFLGEMDKFMAIVPKETAETLLNIKDEYTQILLETAKKTKLKPFINELSKDLSKEYKVTQLIDEAQMAKQTQSISIPFMLITILVLIMSIFIIYSSFKVITLERLPYLGTFRSVGATEKLVKRILVLESAIFGVIGGAIGVPLGFGILKLMLNKLSTIMPEGMDIGISASTSSIIFALLLAVIVSMFSAYIPARRVSKLPVKDIVLGNVEPKATSKKLKLILGINLLALSMLLPYIVPQKFANIVGGVSIFMLVISTVLVIPLLTVLIVKLLEVLYGVIFGNEGRLALKNIKWNKNINQNITLLVISISSFLLVMMISMTIKSYMSNVYGDAKIDGYTFGQNLSDEFIEKIRKIEAVDKVVPSYFISSIKVEGKEEAISMAEGVVNINDANEICAVKYESNKNKEEMITEFDKGRNILVTDAVLNKLEVKIGDIIKLKTEDGIKDYKIIGKIKIGISRNALIPGKYFKEDFKAKGYTMAYINSSKIETVVKEVKLLYNGKDNGTSSLQEEKEDNEKLFGVLFGILNGFNYILLLIGIVGVINNLIINFIQRKRTIAMYKSVGLSKNQLIKMTLIEAFTTGVIGGAIGIVVTYLEVKVIFKILQNFIDMKPDYSLSIFIIAAGMGILITLLGSVVPLVKSSKLQVIEAIKYE